MKKRILYISPGFPTDEKDTSCIPALQEFLAELNKRDIDPLVIALHYPYSAIKYVWKGINVHALGLNNPHVIKRLWLEKKIPKQIQQLAIEHKTELIHSFWIGDAAWYGQNIAKALEVPHVSTAMGRDFESKSYYKRVIKQSFKTVALSDFHNLKLKENGLISNQVIPHGLSTRNTTQIEKSIDLLFAGSLIDLKQPFDFIECCKQLKEYSFDFKAVMIGSGPLEKQIRERINSYGLENNIQLTGQLSREAALKIMDQSKVLYHPSSYESFGMVILEAIRSRMHVISSPVGISPEINQVHLVESPEDAADVTKKLINEPTPKSLIPFSIYKTVERYLEVYNSLLNR